jgi:O-antigen/teichoic acid export membrane protein
MPRVLRHIGWTVGGDLVARGLTLLSTIVVARLMSPTDFGGFLALLAASLLATVAFDAGLSTLCLRAVATSAVDADVALTRVLRLRLFTLPAGGAVFVIAIVVARLQHVTAGAVLAFGGMALAASFTQLGLSLLRGSARFAASSSYLLVGRVLTFVLLVVVAFGHGEASMTAVGVIFAIGEMTAAALTLRAVGRLRRGSASTITLRSAIPFAANSSLTTLYNRFDVILVAGLAGSAQVGVYAPASRLQDGLYVLPAAVGTVSLAYFSGLTETLQIRAAARKFALAGSFVAVFVVAAVEGGAVDVARYVFGESYTSSATAIRILVCFLPLAMIQAPLVAAVIAVGREREVTKLFGISLVAALTAHLVCDPRWGATGAACASLARDLVATPVALWMIVRCTSKAPGRIAIQAVAERLA